MGNAHFVWCPGTVSMLTGVMSLAVKSAACVHDAPPNVSGHLHVLSSKEVHTSDEE